MQVRLRSAVSLIADRGSMRTFFAACFALMFLCSCSHQHANLPVEQVTIVMANGATHGFTVEIAADAESRAHGLMERTDLPADAGMLFDYHTPQPVAFWMKNTPLPLDMLFIRADGTIVSVVANATPYSEKPIPSVEPVQAVLELNGGRAAELGIQPGDHVQSAIFSSQNAKPHS